MSTGLVGPVRVHAAIATPFWAVSVSTGMSACQLLYAYAYDIVIAHLLSVCCAGLLASLGRCDGWVSAGSIVRLC